MRILNRTFFLPVLFLLIGLAAPDVFADVGGADFSSMTKRYSGEFVPEKSAGIAVLRENIENLRRQILKTDKTVDPVKWAEEQHTLGVILFAFEEQDFAAKSEENLWMVDASAKPSPQSCEPCLLLLGESLSALRAALEVRTRKTAPADWAETQFETGCVLMALGGLESGTERLKEASTAFREALRVYNRQKNKESWSRAQFYLAETLQKLGNLESGDAGKEYFKKSIAGYQEVLKAYTPENIPDEWAAIQNNLGNTLSSLGYRDNNRKYLEKAVIAFRAALAAVNRETKPWSWAATQNNLGNVLRAMGGKEKNKKYLEEAINAYQAALTIRTPEKDLSFWGGTQENLAGTLRSLGMLETGAAASEYLNRSVAAYRVIIEAAGREKLPVPQAVNLLEMADTLYNQGRLEKDMAKMEEAIITYRTGLNLLADEVPHIVWARLLLNFANLLQVVGAQDSGTRWLEEAIAAYRKVWNAYNQIEGVTRADVILLETGLGRAEKLLKERQAAGQ